MRLKRNFMFFEKNYTLYKRNNGSYARHCVYCIIYMYRVARKSANKRRFFFV